LGIEGGTAKDPNSSFGVINVHIKDKKLNFSTNNTIIRKEMLINDSADLIIPGLACKDERNRDCGVESKFMSKKKSVVNIVKIPLIPQFKERAFKINKNLLQPINLNSQMNKSSEKIRDRRIVSIHANHKENNRSMSDAKKALPKKHKISKFKSKLF
jgi:hypothetical protein